MKVAHAEPVFRGTTLLERFWSKVDRTNPDGCWLWLRATRKGYGSFTVYTKARPAHRFSWELVYGPIPDGMTLDHLCRNRACVNPTHLEPVTGGENVLRGVGPTAANARKTHCAHGHPLSGDNLCLGLAKGKTTRVCRACKRNRTNAGSARRAAREGRRLAKPPGERTHCPKGHPYAGDNLYINPSRSRQCRTCMKARKLVAR